MTVDDSAALQRGLDALAPSLIEGALGVTGLQRLSGGASQETWSFALQFGSQPALPLVLRRASRGSAQRAAGNASLAAEAQIIALAAAAGVPVPRVHAVLSPAMGLGEGFVMQHVEGQTLGRKIVADARLAPARAVLARQCGLALARIHRIDTTALPPLRRAPVRDQLAYYEAQHRSHGTYKPVFELALRWLKLHAPDDAPRLSLVHGDFRNGNIVVDESGLRAVLDWEMAHLGDPMEDLGWLCVNSWRFGHVDLPVGGFGEREELFAGYREAGGTADADHVRFWEVLGTLKWGVICESMAQSYLSGAERNVERAAIGRRASEAEIDLLCLLAPRQRRAA
jgi:aminoglycoside phosphotransferase (APT) family kinase protein